MCLVITVALLAALGEALSLFHLLSLLLVAGVGLDYGLFFDRMATKAEDPWPALRANLAAAATSITVFTVLALSAIPLTFT